MNSCKVFLETGQKKVFAGAVDWPGWCRSARDEQTALQALVDYGPRYAQVLAGKGFEFLAPASPGDLTMVERIDGNTSTDFGVPSVILESDREPVSPGELERYQSLLRAYWQAFDDAMERSVGKALRKGPRGGGRDSDMILEHVLGADSAYLDRLAWKHKPAGGRDQVETLAQTRQAVLNALEAAVNGELPKQGPKGGAVWPPRYFVRRVAWHVLDHTWEISDRLE